MSRELEDRRQRAREAAYDAEPDDASMHYDRGSIAAAIEVATRVQITPELARIAYAPGAPYGPMNKLRAVFEAAGFEVVT